MKHYFNWLLNRAFTPIGSGAKSKKIGGQMDSKPKKINRYL